MTRTEQELRLHYTVHNTSPEPVVLLDRLLRGDTPMFSRVVVRDGDVADVASFVRGEVGPPLGVGAMPESPAARILPPDGSISDDAVVPLPLVAFHNYATPRPLTGTPRRVYLEVGYLVGPAELNDMRLDDGQTVKVPVRPYDQRLVRSDTRDLP